MVKLRTAISDTCGVDGWYSGWGKVTTRSESLLQYEQSFKLGYRWPYILCIPLKYIKSPKKHFKSGKSFRDCIHRPFTFPSLSNLACFTQVLTPSPQTRGGVHFYYPAITRNSKCQCNNWFCSQLCLKIVLHWFLKMKLLESQCRVIFHCQLCNDLMALYFCKSSLQDESSTSTANFHCLLIDLDSGGHKNEERWAIINLMMVGRSGEWVRSSWWGKSRLT